MSVNIQKAAVLQIKLGSEVKCFRAGIYVIGDDGTEHSHFGEASTPAEAMLLAVAHWCGYERFIK